MSFVNRYQGGSTYPQAEKDREANAGGKSRSESTRRKPVEVGKEYDVDIVEKSRREDGVARIDNFVVFVRKGAVGERARIKIESVSENFAVASIVQTNEAPKTGEEARPTV